MARVGADGGKYPPTEFSTKYAAVLAPKGKLVSPKDVFGEEGCFDKGRRITDNPPSRSRAHGRGRTLLSYICSPIQDQSLT